MGKLEVIFWADAVAGNDWVYDGTEFRLHPACSVGFLVHEDGESLTLAVTRATDENGENLHYNATMTIPKGWISERITKEI